MLSRNISRKGFEISTLTIKPAVACKWNILSLGEVMNRLDPGDSRVARTQQFQIWKGDSKYNFVRT
jgi:2-dehydro-3-deoxygluconokinase